MDQQTSKAISHHKIEWTREEDEFILRSIGVSRKPYNWKLIAEKGNQVFPTKKKSAQEYNRRWQFLTSIERTKEPWSKEEELNLILAHNRYKNKWTDISTTIRGRSNNTIKNKFYSIFRRIKGKIKKNDFEYSTRLELLEIYYVIAVIEEYLECDKDSAKAKGRRGKDYIWSLIHSIDKKLVTEYKAQLQLITKHQGSLTSILSQLAKENETVIETCAEEEKKIVEEKSKMSIVLEPVLSFDDPFLKPLRFPEQEMITPFESDFEEKSPYFSPSTLSVGPAATAAGASRAACFMDPFGDFSSFVQYNFDESLPHSASKALIEVDGCLRWPN